MADDTDTIDTTDTDTATTDTGADTTTDATDQGGDKGADKAATTTDAGDWRVQLAGTDEKTLAFLGRYTDPKAFVEAAKKANDNGKNLLRPLGDDPSEADIAAHRKAFGVPDDPKGYNDKLTDGLVIGEDDKPIFDKFFDAMHKVHAPAPIVAAVVDAYRGIVEEQDAAIAASAATAKQETEEALRTEWGADYRRNLTAMEGFIGTLPANVQAAINEGFGGNGVGLKSNPAFVQWLAALALDANPLATVVPGASDQPSAIADEIAALEKRMRADRKGWNADEKAQSRYMQLVEARDRLAGASHGGEQG